MRPIDELAAEICTLAGHINAANHRFLAAHRRVRPAQRLVAEPARNPARTGSTGNAASPWAPRARRCASRARSSPAPGLRRHGQRQAQLLQGARDHARRKRRTTRTTCCPSPSTAPPRTSRDSCARIAAARKPRSCRASSGQQQNRRVSFRYDDDGSLILTCQLPAEARRAGHEGARHRDRRSAGVPRRSRWNVAKQVVPYSQRRADALGRVAESFLAHDVLESPGTDRQQIVVHVAAETLRDRTAGCCEIEHGPSIAAETARRFSCDASVVTLVEDADGEPLNVGRKTRTISAPLRRLLDRSRQGLPIPGLLQCALHRHAPHQALGEWRRDQAVQPRVAVPLPSSRRARGWLQRGDSR